MGKPEWILVEAPVVWHCPDRIRTADVGVGDHAGYLREDEGRAGIIIVVGPDSVLLIV